MNKYGQIKESLDDTQNLLLLSYTSLPIEKRESSDGKALLELGLTSTLVDKHAIPLGLEFLENDVYKEDSVSQYKAIDELVKKYKDFFPVFKDGSKDDWGIKNKGLILSKWHPWRDVSFIVNQALKGKDLKSVISILNIDFSAREDGSGTLDLESKFSSLFKVFNYPVRSAITMQSYKILNYLLSLPEHQENLKQTYAIIDEKLKEVFCEKVFSQEEEGFVPEIVSGKSSTVVLKQLTQSVPVHGEKRDEASKFISTHNLTKILNGFEVEESGDTVEGMEVLNIEEEGVGGQAEDEIALFKKKIENPFFELINLMSGGLQSSNETSTQHSALYIVRGLKEFVFHGQNAEQLEDAVLILSNELQIMKLSTPSEEFLKSIESEDGQGFKRFCSLELRVTMWILKSLNGLEVRKESLVEFEKLWEQLPMVKELKLCAPKMGRGYNLSDVILLYTLELARVDVEQNQFLDEPSKGLIVALNKLVPKILNTKLVKDSLIDFQISILEKSRNSVHGLYGELGSHSIGAGNSVNPEGSNRKGTFGFAKVKVFERLLDISSDCRAKFGKNDGVLERVKHLKESEEKYISLSAAFSILFSQKKEYLSWEDNDEVLAKAILGKIDYFVEKLNTEISTSARASGDSRNLSSACDMLDLLAEFKKVSSSSEKIFRELPDFVKQELTQIAVKINFNGSALIGNAGAQLLNERFKYVINMLEESSEIKPLRL